MPDSTAQTFGGPHSWAEAFSALPLETPPAGAWTRVAQALEARQPQARRRREQRANWLIGAASAAVLALAVWTPLMRWMQADPGTGTPSTSTRVDLAKADGSLGPAAPVVAADRIVSAPVRASGVASAGSTSAPDARAERHAGARRQSGTAVSAQADRSHPARPASSAMPETSVAVAEERETDRPAASSTAAVEAASTAGDAIGRLQARSAQLEVLVALARDDRAGSASGALLTSELDASIAAIDAALSQNGLPDGQRAALWQQRVDALQQLANIESTERWLAAQGALYDTALVNVD